MTGYILSVFLGGVIHAGKLLQSPTSLGALKKDGRPLTLWLRSFAAENIRLDSPHSSKILDHHSLFLSLVPTKLETILVEFLSPYTAVLAVDGPRTRKYSLGAYRQSPTEEGWKSAVLAAAQRSELTIISLGSTPSLLWEIQEIPRHIDARRTLFLLPPFKVRKKHEWQLVWNELLARETVLPKIPYREIQERRICAFAYKSSSCFRCELGAKAVDTNPNQSAIE